MLKGIILSLSIIFISCASTNTHIGKDQSFGWDLSYVSLLKDNSISSDEWLFQWCKTRKSITVKQLLSTWDKEPIISSIFLEQPAFHAGEQLVFWFVRTSNNAYYCMILNAEIHKTNWVPIDYHLYDLILIDVLSWEQGPPFKRNSKTNQQLPDGYFAFLSVYNKIYSKQILLSIDEFYKQGEHEDMKAIKHGRVIETFKTILGYW